MTVINPQLQSAAASSNPTLNSTGVAKASPQSVLTDSNNRGQDTTVKISGHAMLLSRVFNTNDMNADIPVEQISRIGAPIYGFLTTDDRKMLETAYQYTADHGMDPQYVDGLAFDLANYRQFPNSKGAIYDMEGHRLTFEFGPSEANAVERIRSGNAINHSSIDRWFIDHVIDTTMPNHAVNFDFLERMMSVFSPAKGELPDDSGVASTESFKNFVPPKHDYITHVSAQPEIVVQKAEDADYISINGVGHWRTPELAAAAARGNAGKGGSGIDFTQYLTPANKQTLTEALLSLLDQRPGKTTARLRNIASALDLNLNAQAKEKTSLNSSWCDTMGVTDKLSRYLDNNNQASFDAASFLEYMFSQKIDTSA